MKRILLLSIFSILTVFTSFSQCTPDFVYTSLGLPGVYPPSIQIPNSPIPTGIADGSLGSNYNQTLTLIVLEDTTLDIGFLLPAAAVTAMNVAGISTVMTVDINHVTFDIQGLPSGINSQCDISNCQYPSGIDGCVKLSGTSTLAGTFPVDINMTINIQIPAITDPIFGTVIFSANSFDIPSFTAQTYDLFINDATSMKNIERLSQIYPNPSNSHFTIEVNSPTNLMIYNNLGELVYSKKIINNININKSEIGTGIFFVEISDKYFVENHKLILN